MGSEYFKKLSEGVDLDIRNTFYKTTNNFLSGYVLKTYESYYWVFEDYSLIK
jgi:hypothetical protein